MELTKTDIVQIVNWGEAEHSQVALDFMAEVKNSSALISSPVIVIRGRRFFSVIRLAPRR